MDNRMDMKKIYNEIIESQECIALASSVDNQPNVRIVNFITDPAEKGKLYFSSFMGNAKVAEFKKNKQVAFTTIPTENEAHIRVSQCQVNESKFSIFDLADRFIEKYPTYKEIIDMAGQGLIVYELSYHEAKVIVDLKNADLITF